MSSHVIDYVCNCYTLACHMARGLTIMNYTQAGTRHYTGAVRLISSGNWVFKWINMRVYVNLKTTVNV